MFRITFYIIITLAENDSSKGLEIRKTTQRNGKNNAIRNVRGTKTNDSN